MILLFSHMQLSEMHSKLLFIYLSLSLRLRQLTGKIRTFLEYHIIADYFTYACILELGQGGIYCNYLLLHLSSVYLSSQAIFLPCPSPYRLLLLSHLHLMSRKKKSLSTHLSSCELSVHDCKSH